MATLEERTARVEGILEEIRTRVTNVENRMVTMDSRAETRFYWLLGILITMWVSLILAILLRG